MQRLRRILLPALDDETLDAVSHSLLPRLTEDWQLPAAEPLLERLDAPRLTSELRHLGQANDFAAAKLSGIVLDRALSAGTKKDVRSALIELPATARRNGMVARTLSPIVEDARWLLGFEADFLDRAAVTAMLLDLLGQASDRQFAAMLGDERVGAEALDAMEAKAPKLLRRAVSGDMLDIETFVRLLPRALKRLQGDARQKLAEHALRRCLNVRFDDEELALVSSLLSAVGDGLDGAWFARTALGRDVDGATASRNMVALRRATQPARLRAAWSMDDIARTLVQRPSLDLDAAAVEACAEIMLDAEKVAPKALLLASGHLMPVLLRSRDRPVSPMIVAAFPSVHRELAKFDDVPDLFKFIPFFDWDRCKAARHELVDAFMSSSWPPSDLALTACRTREVSKILRRIDQQRGGKKYIERLTSEIDKLPDDCRIVVEGGLAGIQQNRTFEAD